MKQNSTKFLLAVYITFSFFVSINFAEASTLTNIQSGITDIVAFINNNIFQKLKNDFCNQYILSVSSGDWKADEFRAKVGKSVCVDYKIPPAGEKLSQTNLENIKQNPSVAKPNLPKIVTLNNSAPNNVVSTGTIGKELSGSSIIYWTNYERGKNGTNLVSLTGNSLLSRIAELRVKDMFQNSYFAHVSPTGDSASKIATLLGYKYITIGENLALGNFDSAEGLVTAWMNSPGHRANILNTNYTEIGISSIEGIYKGEKVSISVQIFGKPLSLCAGADISIKNKIDKYKASAESLAAKMKAIQTALNSGTLSTADYNAKVAEYNTTAKLYNDLVVEIKKLTTEYNSEVQIFNSCIKTT